MSERYRCRDQVDALIVHLVRNGLVTARCHETHCKGHTHQFKDFLHIGYKIDKIILGAKLLQKNGIAKKAVKKVDWAEMFVDFLFVLKKNINFAQLVLILKE